MDRPFVAWLILIGAIIAIVAFLIVDGTTGPLGPELRGTVIDRIYVPERNNTRWVSDDDGGHTVYDHDPEEFYIVVKQLEGPVVKKMVTMQVYYMLDIGEKVIYHWRFGRWTGIAWGIEIEF